MQNETPLLPLPPDLPGFEQAMQHLGTIPLSLYRGLEVATSKASEFRDAECPTQRIDEGLAATLVRFHLLQELKRAGIDAVEDTWELDNLPFLGVAFHCAGYHVKVLKGPKGCLPGCGISSRRIRFYNQIPSMYLVDRQATQTTANLVFLWDFDSSYGLSAVWLALPAVGGNRSGDVSAFWIEKLPHPSEGMFGIIPPEPPPTDSLDDLLIPFDADQSAVGE